MKAVVYGPPCAGKTTIANAISKQSVDVLALSMHDMCISEASKGTDDGIQWQFCDQGRLPFPDGLANRIAEKHLKLATSFVVEGYPKTLDEVKHFVRIIGRPTHLFVVDASLETVLEGARNRLQCPSCSLTFTRGAGVYPQCMKLGRPRKDDESEVVEERFQHYLIRSREALPLLRQDSQDIYEGSSTKLLNTISAM